MKKEVGFDLGAISNEILIATASLSLLATTLMIGRFARIGRGARQFNTNLIAVLAVFDLFYSV